MISALTLADRTGTDITWHESAKRSTVSITGLEGIAVPRAVRRTRPTGHGGLDDTTWTDGSLISIVEEVISTVSQVDAWAEFHAVVKPALETLDYGPALLKWTEGASGIALQKYVKLASDIDAPIQSPGAILTFQAQFFAPDPRSYSQTLQTASSTALSASGGGHVFPTTYPRTYASSGGGTLAFTNNGNRKTPATFRIYGMCINPSIVNLTTGERITLVGTIASGDYLELNVVDRTAKLNGTTLRNNFVDSANTTWFELSSGVVNLQMIAGTFDGSALLTVLGRDAYA